MAPSCVAVQLVIAAVLLLDRSSSAFLILHQVIGAGTRRSYFEMDQIASAGRDFLGSFETTTTAMATNGPHSRLGCVTVRPRLLCPTLWMASSSPPGNNERNNITQTTTLLIIEEDSSSFGEETLVFDEGSSKGDADRYRSNNNKNNDRVREEESTTVIAVEGQQVVADLCALLLATELQGLLDVINAADFVAKGGWFQPVPNLAHEMSTLPILVQRFSIDSVLWLLSSYLSAIILQQLLLRSSSSSSSLSSTARHNPTKKLTVSDATQSSRQMEGTIPQDEMWIAFGIFALLRLVVELIVGLHEINLVTTTTTTATAAAAANALREIYNVGLAIFAIRFLKGKFQ